MAANAVVCNSILAESYSIAICLPGSVSSTGSARVKIVDLQTSAVGSTQDSVWEVVRLLPDVVTDFDALHNRTADEKAMALAFDLLVVDDEYPTAAADRAKGYVAMGVS